MKKNPTRILLIEDNPGDARLVQEALRETGAVRFKLDWEEDLARGLEALRKNPPETILLDLNLPDSLGFDTLKKVHDQFPQIPIILLTGQDDEEQAARIVQEGAEDYIVKGQVKGCLLVRAIRYAIERARIKNQLAESERHYRDLFENAILAAFQSSPEGKIITVNHAFARMFGYASPEEVRAQLTNAADAFAEPARRAEILRLMAGNPDLRTFENLYRRKDGSTFPGNLNVRPVKDGEGRLLFMEGFIEDLTERKRMEQAVYLMSDTQQQIAHLESAQEIFKLVGKKVQELIGDGYVSISILDEQIQAMKVLDLYGLGPLYKKLVGKFKVDVSKIVVPLADMTDDELGKFRSGQLEKFEGGLYHLSIKKVPKQICAAAEKELGLKGIYTMGFAWQNLHYGGITILAKSDLTPYKEMIETIMHQATVAMKRIQSEEALRSSEARYRNLVETQSDIIARSDLSGKLTFVNDAYCRIFGKAHEELLGADFTPTVVPEDLPITLAALEAIKKPPYRKQTETRHLTVAGIRWISWENSAVLDEAGNLSELQGVGRDITQRKQAEQALRENEASLQAVLRSTADGILAVGIENEILYANERFAELWKIPAEILASRDDATLLQFVLDKLVDPQGFLQKVQELYKSDKGSFETLYFKDGRIFDRASRPLLQGKQLRGRVWSFRDVTENKRMADKLDEERTLLRTLIDNLPDLIYVMDAQGRKILSNTADWRSSGGKSMEDIIGKTDLEIYPPDLAQNFWARNKQVIESGIPIINFEEPGLDSQGNPIRLLSTKVPLRDGQGKITGLVGVGRDITKRKRAEEDLQASQEAEREFSERLASLSETTTELSKIESVGGLCRRAVELGRERLGFDRLSIWFVTEDHAAITGTFGVDSEGRIVDERDQRIPITPDFPNLAVFNGQEPLLLLTDVPLYLDEQEVGKGAHVSAGLWDGTNVLGVFNVDNLLQHRPITDRDCEIIRLYATALGHLCSLKRTREELGASAERFSKVFTEDPIGMALSNQHYQFVQVNPAFCRMLGYSQQEFEKLTFKDITHPEDVADAIAHVRKLEEGRIPVIKTEKRYIRKDKNVIWASLTLSTILDKGGNIQFFLAMVEDITERKQAEENLHALFHRHEALLAAIPEIVMEVDNHKVYTWANNAGSEFFGEDVIGREAAFFFEGEQTVYQEVQPLFNGNENTIYLESWQRRKDGQKRLLAWWCQVLKDEVGNVIGALSSARDITEQKQVEEQIKKQMAELQRWYELTLDRESRSLELKHEVNELLRRLNEPPRYSSMEEET